MISARAGLAFNKMTRLFAIEAFEAVCFVCNVAPLLSDGISKSRIFTCKSRHRFPVAAVHRFLADGKAINHDSGVLATTAILASNIVRKNVSDLAALVAFLTFNSSAVEHSALDTLHDGKPFF